MGSRCPVCPQQQYHQADTIRRKGSRVFLGIFCGVFESGTAQSDAGHIGTARRDVPRPKHGQRVVLTQSVAYLQPASRPRCAPTPIQPAEMCPVGGEFNHNG